MTTFAYTPFGLTASGRTAEGIETRFTYDANNNKTKEETYTATGGTVGTVNYEYDILDRVSKKTAVIDGSGAADVTVTTYDGNGNVLTMKEGSGATIKFAYDEMNRAKEKRIVMDPNDASRDIVTAYAFDRNGNVVGTTAPNGNQASATYDLYDRVTRKTDPAGAYSTSTYDQAGNVIETDTFSSTGTLLAKSTAAFDQLGHAVRTTSYDLTNQVPANIVTTQKYDRNGNPTVATDARGNATTTAYDILGRPVSVTDALGNMTVLAYDKRSLVTSKSVVPNTGTGTITTASAYDNDGRLVSETDNLGKTKTLTYNALGQVVSSKDEENNVTAYDRDYRGKSTKETKYLSGGIAVATAYGYDERGNLTSVTDPKGNATTYQYDALSRNTKTVYADGKALSYAYDKDSNVVSQTDPNGTVVTSMYDVRNLLASKAIATGTGVVGTTSETYSYDPLGRVISANDSGSGRLDFAYDSQGHLVSETGSGTSVGYAYDPDGNLAKIVYPDLREQSYAYDALNRNTTIVFCGGTIATYAYTGILNTGVTYGNGKTMTQTFDGLNRLKTLNNGVNSYSYAYDGVGNMLSDGQKNYGYDSIYRLTQANDSMSGTVLENFAYDKAGNRTTDANGQYVTNALNQYSSLSGSTNAAYAYDNNGNVTNNGKYAFAYDYKNRLVKVSTGATSIEELSYDVLGRRISKKTQADTTKYAYANDNILTEARTQSGSATTFHKTYVNGLGTDDLIAYDNEEVNLSPNDKAELSFCTSQVLSATGGFVKYGYQNIVDRCTGLSNSGSVVVTNRYYFHKNHLGSVTGLTNGA